MKTKLSLGKAGTNCVVHPPFPGYMLMPFYLSLPDSCRRSESESESEVAQLCLTLCDSVDCSLPDSSIHGILQARILEWVAISFSKKVRNTPQIYSRTPRERGV